MVGIRSFPWVSAYFQGYLREGITRISLILPYRGYRVDPCGDDLLGQLNQLSKIKSPDITRDPETNSHFAPENRQNTLAHLR